jgi:surfactin synthase thioesterase subunit
LNEAFAKYMTENPDFQGKVVFMGHSLGGILLYDIIANQHENPVFKADGIIQKKLPDQDIKNHANLMKNLAIGEKKTHYEFK